MRSPQALKAAMIGVGCQFLLMPLISYLLTIVFDVDGYTAFGFLLVGCMPGGNTSNIFSLWSGGVLELSVFMTCISMLLSFGLTPLCLKLYSTALHDFEDASSVVAMEEIFLAFLLLLIPLSIGISFHCFACTKRYKQRIEQCLSIFAFIMFAIIIVLLVKDYAPALEDANYQSIVPAVLIFPLSTGLAYIITTLCQLDCAIKRTIVFEVGFQNVAMGFAIGAALIPEQSLRNETVPFPLIYGTTQFVWAGILIPLFRYQKRYNDAHNIVDLHSDVFIRTGHDNDQNDNDNNNDSANANANANERGDNNAEVFVVEKDEDRKRNKDEADIIGLEETFDDSLLEGMDEEGAEIELNQSA